MKNLRINKSQLEIRRALPIVEKFRILKLSATQALVCKTTEFSSWEEVLARYGAENLLKEGEEYRGYVLVWHGARGAEINALYGSLRIVHDPRTVYWADSVMKKAFTRKDLLSVSCGGGLFYVWTFSDCHFDEGIRQKIAEALKNKVAIVSLSDEEVRILKEYLGEYYRRFFIELD